MSKISENQLPLPKDQSQESQETKPFKGENSALFSDTHQLRALVDEYLDVERKIETKRSQHLDFVKKMENKKKKKDHHLKKLLRVQSELEPSILSQNTENDASKGEKLKKTKTKTETETETETNTENKSREKATKNYEVEVGGLFGLSHPLRSANPCALEVAKRKIPPHVAASFREKISLYLNSLECPEEYRLSPHFEQNDLTPHKLRHIFNVLDVYWYSGTLLSTIRKKEQVRLFWTYEPFAKGKKSFQPAAKTVALTEVKNKKLVELHWYFNKNRYAHSANCRTTNGIAAKHKLDALLITSLHEITHAIFYVWCPAENGHGEKFLKWNNSVHGSDEKQFGYQDSSVCPIPQNFNIQLPGFS